MCCTKIDVRQASYLETVQLQFVVYSAMLVIGYASCEKGSRRFFGLAPGLVIVCKNTYTWHVSQPVFADETLSRINGGTAVGMR